MRIIVTLSTNRWLNYSNNDDSVLVTLISHCLLQINNNRKAKDVKAKAKQVRINTCNSEGDTNT